MTDRTRRTPGRDAPTRVAIYARISLDRSGERLGVTRQVEECRAHAEQRGWTVIEKPYVDNDISAKSGKPRVQFERLLADIASGDVDGLVSVHLDRVLRRVVDLERILNALDSQPTPVQVSFVNAGDLDLTTASGRLLARILASVASAESEQKGERVRSARRQEALSGRAHTALGYGYNLDRSLNPYEVAVIKDVATRLLGGKSLYSIANSLNDDGVPTPGAATWTSRHVTKEASRDDADPAFLAFVEACRAESSTSAKDAVRLLTRIGSTQPGGKRWSVSAVRGHPELNRCLLDEESLSSDGDIGVLLNVLNVPPPMMRWRLANLRSMIRRGTLCGWRDYGPGGRGERGEMVAKGDWTPILSRATTDAIRRITDKSEPVKGGRKAKHLLSGIAKCGRCGAPLSGGYDSRAKTARYGCSQQPGLPERCGKLSVVAEPVDRAVTALLLARISETPLTARQRRSVSGARVSTDTDIKEAEQTLVRIRELRRFYAKEAADEIIDPEEWATAREALAVRQKAAEEVIGTFEPTAQVVLTGVPRRSGDLRTYWESATLERQREIVKLLIEKIVIAPSTRGGNQFDFSRIGTPTWRL